MGRYLLFICSGLVIILGLVKISTQNRQTELIKRSANAANRAQARNMANEAIDLTLQKLDNDPAWRNGYQPWSVTLDHGTASVKIIDYTTDTSLTYKQLKLISTSKLNKNSAKVITKVQEKYGLPYVPSAMGFYSDTLSFKANGTSFVINGNDTKLDGTAGYGQPVSGISVPGTKAYNTISDAMNQNQSNQITGAGGTSPNIKTDPSLSPKNLEQNAQKFLNNADTTYYAGSYTGTQFGTASHPKITVVDGDISVKGTSGGCGIMIVQNASQLTLGGTFTFDGLIIMQGGMFQSSGDVYINGSVQFGSTQSTEFYGAQLSGNININYSTQAFQKVEGGLGKKLGMRFQKIKTYE